MKTKKTKSFVLLILTIASVIFLLSSCTTKPWNYNNVEWYSNEPYIYFSDSDKFPDSSCEGILKADGKDIEIAMLWGPTLSFHIVDKNKYYNNSNEYRLIDGKVEYDENSVTLIITKDNVFGGKYSKITLFRRDI